MSVLKSTTVSLLLILLTSSQIKCSIICPPSSEIAPCQCFSDSVVCSGSSISQDSINLVFSAIRTVNNVSSKNDIMLDISKLEIVNTNLESLDISLMVDFNFTKFFVQNNPKLSYINHRIDNTTISQFAAEHVTLFNCSLSDKSVANLLEFILPTSLKYLYLTLNKVEGSMNGTEFISGIFSFPNLTFLDVSQNFVRSLGGGQFRKNTKLYLLNFSKNNITQLSQDAFLLDVDPDMEDTMLQINLNNNYLDDQVIHANHGLESSNRQTIVTVWDNKFTFISAQKFETFFYRNLSNKLFFGGKNRFYCDAQMKWLKDAKEVLETRAQWIDCTNDPGKTIFTTDLV